MFEQVWQNFINLSEEEQAKYLSGPRQRSQLFDWTKPEAALEPPSFDEAPAGESSPEDGRSVHPAALPSGWWHMHFWASLFISVFNPYR
jgi:hypothetical protein